MAIKRFFKQLSKELIEEDVTDVGAMLAYYTVLALFPMLVFVLSLSLLVLDESIVREGVALALGPVPISVREMINARVNDLIAASGPHVAIVGLTLALWGASRGATALQTALNVIFNKPETRSWIRRQLTALAVTVGVALMVVVALSLLVAGPFVGHFVADRFGLGREFDIAWDIVRWVGAGVLVMVVWAIIYKFLANTDAPFRVFTPGAFVGVLGWLTISALFGLYLKHFNSYEATYGTLGTAIVFLTWLWMSNIALLVGAQINGVLAELRARKDPASAELADPNEHAHGHTQAA